MEETTPTERASSALVVGFKLVPLLVKGDECGELVLPSLPPLVRRTEEREELVCGRVRALTGNRENNPVPAVSRMEESTPPERANSILVLSLVSLLVKGGEREELVLPSLPPLVRRTEEREELVCGRVRVLTGRENNPVAVVSVWSEEGEEQEGGWGKVWQHSLPFKVEESVCAEPHLEVDKEEEPHEEGMQETGQT